jgi:coenzyme F420-dependent glucose-6-phosphate dehydrogenase
MERRAAEVADQAHRRWLIADNAEAHVEQVRPYVELGFTHLVFHAPGDDQMEFLRLYGDEILPRLRELEIAPV